MPRRPTAVKTILLATAALLALTMSSCGDDDEPTTMARDDGAAGSTSLDDLDGRAFASVRVDGHRLVDGTQVRLAFDGDALSADAGCNHLFGTIAVADERLTATDMGGTEMGCPDGRNDQDAWLTTFLGDGPTVALDGDTLVLTGGDVVLELVEQDVPDEPVHQGDPDEPVSDDDEGVVVE
ncbi:META domain-containing protein [Nocardioides stalactiti]|uniref:META domain-containing protein n=1 Tax=Nocardioides stalactiti TaxID=2755356 RepID=UPI0016034767|nr:META domain-containing protein [Nocardioides stalactiti]